jgi:hypothetical protein
MKQTVSLNNLRIINTDLNFYFEVSGFKPRPMNPKLQVNIHLHTHIWILISLCINLFCKINQLHAPATLILGKESLVPNV